MCGDTQGEGRCLGRRGPQAREGPWVWGLSVPAQPLASCAALDKSLHLPGPQFLHLKIKG